MAQHGLRATPYLMVVDLIRQLCDTPETDSPEAVATKVHRRLAAVQLDPEAEAPYLLRLLGMPGETARLPFLSPEVLKTHTLAAMLRLCLSASRQRPVVIELEDLRWIDASSEKCLTALADRLSGAAILILGTYRPGYRPAWLDKSYATQLLCLGLPAATACTWVNSRPYCLAPPRWAISPLQFPGKVLIFLVFLPRTRLAEVAE